jgi:hypothetical protein
MKLSSALIQLAADCKRHGAPLPRIALPEVALISLAHSLEDDLGDLIYASVDKCAGFKFVGIEFVPLPEKDNPHVHQ